MNNTPDAPFLMINCGTVTTPGITVRGDYEARFGRHAGLAEDRYEVHYAYQNSNIPAASGYAGVIVSGAINMVTDHEPWSEALAAWLRDAINQGVPIFASCYGHQLIAYAMGGKVGDNPRGPEYTTTELTVTEAGHKDVLLSDFKNGFCVHEQHFQSVLSVPDSASVLASNEHDAAQMLRYGPHVWTVQFHPESVAEDVLQAIEKLTPIFVQHGLNPDEMKSKVQDTDDGEKLLKQFVAYCSEPLY